MITEAFMRQAQQLAESLMVDEVTVTRPTGETQSDPETGVTTPIVETVYKGKAKVQTAGGIASNAASFSGSQTSLGGEVQQWSLYLHFPINVADLRKGDLVHIDVSMNPSLIGRTLRLINLQSEKTHATSSRWNVKEVTGDGDA